MSNPEKIRLDKWLWAARFFKTRRLAQTAISGGKVHYNGQRCKTSQLVQLDSEVTITQGLFRKTVLVMALSDKRGPATEAAKLYQETEASMTERESLQQKRKAAGTHLTIEKPDKRGRKQLRELKGKS